MYENNLEVTDAPKLGIDGDLAIQYEMNEPGSISQYAYTDGNQIHRTYSILLESKGIIVNMPQGTVWVGGDYTHTDYRGKGVHRYCRANLYAHLKKAGHKKAWVMIDQGNSAARASTEKLGSVVIGKVHIYRFLIFWLSYLNGKIKTGVIKKNKYDFRRDNEGAINPQGS